MRLKWGTKSENQLDRFRLHGDHSRGERNNRSLLTEADVLEIRASSEPYRALAGRFGVSEANIAMVRSRRTWAHVA